MNKENKPRPPSPYLAKADGYPIHPAFVVSSNVIPGFRIVYSYGIVRGLSVRSPGFGRGISAAFEALGGGSVNTLKQVCEQARNDAFYKMLEHAKRFGANGIVGFRYDTTEIGENITEVLAYGTAVWVEAAD